jgi:EAL domain-containing protein (putative c-di-GMP-specific phosphodiesterase class I)
LLRRITAARSSTKSPVAPAPTPAPPTGPATVESLGQQLREVLPARRLHSVSLCDHEANVLWLSEGALGPDEHLLVVEALEVLGGDAALPCHEIGLEDGRLAVFLPVRAPMGSLVGVAMILADSKSVGDDTLERMTAAPVRTIMQRLAVLLKPSGAVENPPEVPLPDLDLALETVLEPAAAPAAEPPADEASETIITAAEIATILELEVSADEPPPTVTAVRGPTVAAPRDAAKPPAASAPEAAAVVIEEMEMVRLEFLAEPPVVRPAPNPSAVAKKLHAATKAAEVAPTRTPRPIAAHSSPSARAPGVKAAPSPRAKPPAAAPTPITKAVPAARPEGAAAASNSQPHPFEPVPAHSHLSLSAPDDDVVVLFDSDPRAVPSAPAGRPAAARPAPAAPTPTPAPAPPAARTAPAPRPPQAVPAPAARPPASSARIAQAVRSAPAVRMPQAVATSTPAPAAAPVPVTAPPRAAAPAPIAAVAPAPTPAPAPPIVVTVPAAAEVDSSLPIELLPFGKLRAGGQTRRLQVQPRTSAAQRDAAVPDEQTLQQLLAWLAAHRSAWNSVPTGFTVNLSIATLEDERFLQKIGAALNSHGIAGETLGFEIAETLCTQHRAPVERFIAQCEKLGVWVAIDDFTFDSQVLPLLRSRALRMLKIDARLTSAVLRDKLSQAVVVASVQAAKVVGIHTSAKKVDTPALLQWLTAIGLDYAQGAALWRAVPLEGIASLTDIRTAAPPLV